MVRRVQRGRRSCVRKLVLAVICAADWSTFERARAPFLAAASLAGLVLALLSKMEFAKFENVASCHPTGTLADCRKRNVINIRRLHEAQVTSG